MSYLNWDIIPEELNNMWLQPDFILKKLYAFSVESVFKRDNDLFEKTIDNIPIEVWGDKNFLIKALEFLIKCKYQKKIPDEVWGEDNIWEAITTNQKFFELIWEHIIYNMSENKEKTNTQLDNFKDKILILINDKNWMKKNYFQLDKFYKLLSEDNKSDIEIIKHVVLNYKTSFTAKNPQESIPITIFNDMNKITEIWNYMNENNISMHYTYIKNLEMSLDTKGKYIQFLSLVFNDWGLSHIWDCMPKEYKRDKEIILSFLEKRIDIYTKLSKKWRNNKDIIEVCIKRSGAKYIDNEILFALKDKSLIDGIVASCAHILSDEQCPLEWRKNIDYIKLFTSNAKYLNLSESDWLEITKNDINICLDLMDGNSSYYECFTREMREQVDLVKKYLVEERHCDLSLVPREIWYDRGFCLFIARECDDYISHIPTYYWHEKEFMEGYCKLLDELNITPDCKLIKLLPVEIKTYFNTFDINKDYSKFLSLHIISTELNVSETKQVKRPKI
jgi:hypothetical protein